MYFIIQRLSCRFFYKFKSLSRLNEMNKKKRRSMNTSLRVSNHFSPCEDKASGRARVGAAASIWPQKLLNYESTRYIHISRVRVYIYIREPGCFSSPYTYNSAGGSLYSRSRARACISREHL